MKTIRFSTLIRQCGIPFYWDSCQNPKTSKAANAIMHAKLNRKIVTIHYAETTRGAFWAEPGKCGVNVVGFAVFDKSIPADVGYIVGVEQHIGNMREIQKLVGAKGV